VLVTVWSSGVSSPYTFKSDVTVRVTGLGVIESFVVVSVGSYKSLPSKEILTIYSPTFSGVINSLFFRYVITKSRLSCSWLIGSLTIISSKFSPFAVPS